MITRVIGPRPATNPLAAALPFTTLVVPPPRTHDGHR